MRTGETVFRRMFAIGRIGIGVACCLVLPLYLQAQVEITLENKFIDLYKDRVTIEAQYTVDKAHVRPNPPSKDGDLHIAGRCPEAQLPVVAEIMNAAAEKSAVGEIHQVESTGRAVAMTGVWRLWCEHAGNYEQVQGKALDAFTTTNPAHVFEIHPVTKLEDEALLDSLHPIRGFIPKRAQDAFTRYEGMQCKIIPDPGGTTTTLVTKGLGYNYVEFLLEVPSKIQEVTDGCFLRTAAMDLTGEVLVQDLRMAFVKGSKPEAELRRRKAGDTMHVLGIPRIDLALVAWRADHAKDRPYVLDWGLPYEIVIVGVYPATSSSMPVH